MDTVQRNADCAGGCNGGMDLRKAGRGPANRGSGHGRVFRRNFRTSNAKRVVTDPPLEWSRIVPGLEHLNGGSSQYQDCRKTQ
jgi:hypothetical protein